MFNFGENGKNFINLKLDETIFLLVTIVLLIVGIIVYFTCKDKVEHLLKKLVVFALIYSVAIILYFVINNAIADWEYYQQYQLWILVGLFMLIVVACLLAIVNKQSQEDTTRAIAYGAVCIAISFALSYIRLFRLPQGGSITMASLSLLAIYSYMFGVKRGVLVGLAYGILQAIQDPWVVHPIQFVLDYPLAFAMIGLVGVFKGKLGGIQRELLCGFVVFVILRYTCHFFSGAVWFGEYGADFGLGAWAWGAVYNLFVPIDGAIACVVTCRLVKSSQIKHLMINNSEISN